MIGSAKKMFLLSLGLLLSTVTVIRAEVLKVDDVNIEVLNDADQATKDKEVADAKTKQEAADKQAAEDKAKQDAADKQAAEDKAKQDAADKANDKKSDSDDKDADAKDSWFTSSWNGTCERTNDGWAFVKASPIKSAFMLVGVIKSITFTYDMYNVFFGEEDKSVRRRPRFNSVPSRVDTTN